VISLPVRQVLLSVAYRGHVTGKTVFSVLLEVAARFLDIADQSDLPFNQHRHVFTDSAVKHCLRKRLALELSDIVVAR